MVFKKYNKKCLHIFRRDYRINDNTSLISANKKYQEIIPIFIFTYKQIRDNSLKSEICVKFLVESQKNLLKKIKIQVPFHLIKIILNMLKIEIIKLQKQHINIIQKLYLMMIIAYILQELLLQVQVLHILNLHHFIVNVQKQQLEKLI